MDAAVEVDKGDGGVAGMTVTRLDVGARGGGDDGEDDPHAGHARQHQRTAADARRQEGEGKGAGEAEHLRRGRDERRLNLLRDAGALEHGA